MIFLSFFSRLEETREELEEFQIGSRELEAELEAQLEQAETRCSDLRSQLNRVALEKESLQVLFILFLLSLLIASKSYFSQGVKNQ